MSSPLAEEDDDLGPITPEFIARINSGLAAPMLLNKMVKPKVHEKTIFPRRMKRPREEVSSRSRSEIINWVLGNEELIRVCICPYCLKIHSRRDNARVHIKNQHPGLEVRDFDVTRDASVEQVRNANTQGKCELVMTRIVNRVAEKRPSVPLPEQPEVKVFNAGDPLEVFLKDIDKHVRQKALEALHGGGEAGTSGGIEVPNSTKESREASPNSSLQGTPTSASPQSSLSLPFGCVFCPCSFLLISELSTHTNNTHRTRYRCNGCFAEFVHSKQLEEHYLKDHARP